MDSQASQPNKSNDISCFCTLLKGHCCCGKNWLWDEAWSCFPEHRIFVGCHQTWFGQFPAISASISGFCSHVWWHQKLRATGRGVVPIPPHEKLVNKPIEARLNGHLVFDQNWSCLIDVTDIGLKLVNMFFVIFLFLVGWIEIRKTFLEILMYRYVSCIQ